MFPIAGLAWSVHRVMEQVTKAFLLVSDLVDKPIYRFTSAAEIRYETFLKFEIKAAFIGLDPYICSVDFV